MKDELKRYIEILKKQITAEEMNIAPDVERLQSLQEDYYYLDNANMAMQRIDVEMHAATAERLCNKSSQLIDEHIELISLATIGETPDSQGLYIDS